MATNSDNFDLKNWKLTLPVDSNGGITGGALEVKNLVGYEHSKYFYDAPDGGMVFTAFAEGATTGGSKYPRSELREMNGTKLAAWQLTEGGTMTATLAINEAPTRTDGTTGRFIVGQIHGKDEELIRLYWDNGKVYFVNDHAIGTGKETTYNFYDADGKMPNVSLNEKFSYKIDAYGDTLKVDVYADGKVYTSVTKIDPFWQPDTFYFKAGVYMGINETNGSGEAQATFYGLDFSHVRGEGLDGLVLQEPPAPPPVVEPEPPVTPPVVTPPVTPPVKPPVTPPVTPPVSTDPHKMRGTEGNDTLKGTSSADEILGANGNDIIYGNAGDDIIYGNNGNDTIYGGAGKDLIKGGDGKDIFAYKSITEAGDTILDFRVGEFIDISDMARSFSNGGDKLSVANMKAQGFLNVKTVDKDTSEIYIDMDGTKGSGKAILLATVDHDGSLSKDTAFKVDTIGAIGSGNDIANGTNGNDVIKGQNGNDILYGDKGDDEIWGGNGDDKLIGGAGKDWLKGGDGKDTFIFKDIGDIGDIISDYREGDKIDIAALVDQFSNGGKDMSFKQLRDNGFLTFKDTGDQVNEVYVDMDGAKGSGKAVLLATVFGDDDVRDQSSFVI